MKGRFAMKMGICAITPAALALLAAAGTANAAITFGPVQNLATPQRPSGAAIADFNADSLPDLAVTTDTIDKITVSFGNGLGGFTGPVNSPTGSGTGPDSLAALDFDGDGDTDLAVVLRNSSTLVIFSNTGAGTFVNSGISAPLGANARSLIRADLNGDGMADFATANRDANSATIVLRAGASLVSSTLATGVEPYGVAAGDITGDGIADLAVTCHRDRTVQTFRGVGGGAFTLAQTLPVNPTTRPDGVAVTDLNGDTRPDLAVSVSDNDIPLNQVAVFLNSAGAFAAFTPYNTGGTNPSTLIAADFDRNGATDVAVINEDSGNISVLAGNGAGGLGAPLVIATGARPTAIAAGDFNADTMPDLAVPNRDSNSTSVLFNTAQPPVLPCNPDFNADGNADQDDVAYLVNVIAGGSNPTGRDPDFNRDGNIDQDDYIALVNVIAGGNCP
jgi:hypothetical protein